MLFKSSINDMHWPRLHLIRLLVPYIFQVKNLRDGVPSSEEHLEDQRMCAEDSEVSPRCAAVRCSRLAPPLIYKCPRKYVSYHRGRPS